MPLDRYALIDQLAAHYHRKAAETEQIADNAQEAVCSVATAAEKREDARTTVEYGSLATGQQRRLRQIREELACLITFRNKPLPHFNRNQAVALGAIVDLLAEDEEERTFVILPVGAGTELTGPHGDGLISVLTPASPIGKGLMGKKVGEGVDVQIRGAWHSWTVVDIC